MKLCDVRPGDYLKWTNGLCFCISVIRNDKYDRRNSRREPTWTLNFVFNDFPGKMRFSAITNATSEVMNASRDNTQRLNSPFDDGSR